MRFLTILIAVLLLPGSRTLAQKGHKKKQQLPERNADGEYPNPFLHKPFKPGVPRKMHLIIPMGKINLEFDIVYELENDEDGMMYSWGQRYRADFQKVTPTGPNKSLIPPVFSEILKESRVELNEQEVLSRTLRTGYLFYLFSVQDFNADGVPDFTFVEDPGFHGAPVSYAIWLNIKGNLVYWNGLSGAPCNMADRRKRIIETWTTAPTESFMHATYYQVTNDSTLTQIEYTPPEDTQKIERPIKPKIKKKQHSKTVSH